MGHPFERRRFDRFKPEYFTVRYKHEREDVEYKVEVINISASGICFIRNSLINRDETIIFLFQFKSSKVILRGKIIRVEGREAAATFTDEEEKIERFVQLFNEEYVIIKEESKKEKEDKKSLFSTDFHQKRSSDKDNSIIIDDDDIKL